jgi:hypothetical protein
MGVFVQDKLVEFAPMKIVIVLAARGLLYVRDSDVACMAITPTKSAPV